MSSQEHPRCGSMQYWPRKRAKRAYARIRSWKNTGKPQMLAFAGYKVGMTHVIHLDKGKNSMTKGQEITSPVTIIECPPIKVAAIRFYKHGIYGLTPSSDVLSPQLDKDLKRKICLPNNSSKHNVESVKEFEDLRLVVYTLPSATAVGKKRPEVFEVGLSGSKSEKLELAKQLLTKTVNISDVFKEGEAVDAHAVTKGKGFQGPVKRFGIGIRQHKSEKTKRGPGSLGPWCGQRHIMWRVAHAGKMGYHQRTDYNKCILKISGEVDAVNPKGGFIRYGLVKGSYLLLRGSVPGATKRLILLTPAMRASNKVSAEAPEITYISTESKQG